MRSAKFEVLLQNNFGQLLPLISLEIRLFYRKLNSRNRENSLSVFHRNSPKYSNDQRDKLDWNWLEFYGERNTGFPAITAPRLQTMNQTLTTSKHSIEFTYSGFPGHFKVNCDWPALTFGRWKCKSGKRLTITAKLSIAKFRYSVEREKTAWLAQLVERQSAVRELDGSSPRPDQHLGS